MKYPSYQIFNLDALTYAGNLENLMDIEQNENYNFLKGDIRDQAFLKNIFDKYRFDGVIHLAAETGTGQSMYEIEKYSIVCYYCTKRINFYLV